MRTQLAALLVSLSLFVPLLAPITAQAMPIGDPAFQRTWARTDQPVAMDKVARTWMWGPEALSDIRGELYEQSPGGLRIVQYFDKSRMEITNPSGNPTTPWYVTNGLLVVELVTGRLQLGDATFESHHPAEVNIAGDADDPTGATYATFSMLLDQPPLAENSVVAQRVDRAGSVTTDASLTQWDVRAEALIPETQHRVASVFWGFLHSSGTVYANEQYVDDALFEPWYYASGLPISEAYWTTVLVAGTPHDVLVQAFERRVLTYTPQNPVGWQVEAGNVGQHYRHWRYEVIPGQEPFDVTITDCSDVGAVKTTLEAGGSIRFACGDVTLDLGSAIEIGDDTTIDGSGRTTVSGGNTHQVMMITGSAAGVTVTLRGLTIADGFAGVGGGIHADGSDGKAVTLHLENVVLRDNNTPDKGSGGAIYSSGRSGSATLTAMDTTFTNNTAYAPGGAVVNDGNSGNAVFTAANTIFSGNSSEHSDGGAVMTNGSRGNAEFTAVNTIFSGNTSAGPGGAVSFGNSTFIATNATFTDNSSGLWGGAVCGSGTAQFTATNTLFRGNTAGTSGGAVEMSGFDGEAQFTATNTIFSDNTANIYGGAVENSGLSGSAVFIAVDTTFSGNVASQGGAVHSQGYRGNAAFIVENSTFSNNAANQGGAVYSDGGEGRSQFFAINVTFSGNVAAWRGGGIYDDGLDGDADLLAANATFSGNVSREGGSIYASNDAVSVGNTILATDSPANCDGENATYESRGHNLVTDSSCGLDQPTDLQDTEPQLGPLHDNGGPTLTHALHPGSPAIDSGDPDTCPDIDQRGVSRPQDGDGDGVAGCDRGAVEMAAPMTMVGSAEDTMPSQSFVRAVFEWRPENGPSANVYLRPLRADLMPES